MSDNTTLPLRRVVDVCTVACGLGALALLVLEFGFPLSAESLQRNLFAVRLVLWGIVVLQIVRAFVDADWLRHRWRSSLPILLNGALLLLLALERTALDSLHVRWPSLAQTQVLALYLTAIHLVVLTMLAHRLLRFNQLLVFMRVSPRVILIGSYLALIAGGTALLKFPKATTEPLGWLDALFTSTSAVCVTGLIVVDTSTVFTSTGQMILLGLFQLGGLGVMTFTYFFVSVFGSGVTIRDRALLLEFLNEEHVGRVTGSLIAIIAMTFAFEALGAFLLQTSMPSVAPQSWFASLFHSVSAFCNAGFSLYGSGLHDPLTRANIPYQLVIMALIVIGGLGFPVLKNLWDNWNARLLRPRERPVRLTTHTKLVLVTSAGLILGGAVLAFFLELPSPGQPGESPRWLAALFASITARTAGFNTVPTEALLPPTVFLLLFLMFIGGSPASTAGGIKTTTFAVALLNTMRILRDAGRDLVAFRRQIPAVVANRAFAVVLLAIGWLTISSIILMTVMPNHAPLDVVFETVSAFSTVGLSRGITADMPVIGKLVIIASMLVGRIGILYVALGVLHKERPGKIAYPEGNVIIS